MGPYPDDPRHNAAAMALQIWAGIDPDHSRTMARFVVQAVLRAGVRPTDGLPTEAEVNRARGALVRRGHDGISTDDVYAALLDALCPSLEAQHLPTIVDSSCGICHLEGPDRDGNYDLIPDPRCEVH